MDSAPPAVPGSYGPRQTAGAGCSKCVTIEPSWHQVPDRNDLVMTCRRCLLTRWPGCDTPADGEGVPNGKHRAGKHHPAGAGWGPGRRSACLSGSMHHAPDASLEATGVLSPRCDGSYPPSGLPMVDARRCACGDGMKTRPAARLYSCPTAIASGLHSRHRHRPGPELSVDTASEDGDSLTGNQRGPGRPGHTPGLLMAMEKVRSSSRR